MNADKMNGQDWNQQHPMVERPDASDAGDPITHADIQKMIDSGYDFGEPPF